MCIFDQASPKTINPNFFCGEKIETFSTSSIGTFNNNTNKLKKAFDKASGVVSQFVEVDEKTLQIIQGA